MLQLRSLIFFGLISYGYSDPTGDNTCQVFYNKTRQLNTTYLQSVKESYSETCLSLSCFPTFKTIKYKTVLETRWKLENITRLLVRTDCCDGYKDYDGSCIAHCSEPCVNGVCTSPETCTCHPGYTGLRCQTSGCSNGGWGPSCGNICNCNNGGFCNPVHGGCTCPPGFRGDLCKDKCSEGTYGSGCAQKCSCTVGHSCNHMTGDCVLCKEGLFGEKCTKKCTCNVDGTELCSPIDGKCFCKENRFGLQCEFLCPFGYINNTCFTTPVHNHSCQCANHLYICDLEKGCVCPEGINCGTPLSNQHAEISPLAKSELDSNSGTSATVPVVIVMLLALLIIILLLAYYRRRMKVLKTDLRNRSVRWFSDNSDHNSTRSNNEYVIEDAHPLAESLVTNNLQHHPTTTNIIKTTNLQNIPVLNNQLDFDSQHYHGENPVYSQHHTATEIVPTADFSRQNQQTAIAGCSSSSNGACNISPARVNVMSEKNCKSGAPGIKVKLEYEDPKKSMGLSVDLDNSQDEFTCRPSKTAPFCYDEDEVYDREDSPPPSYESLRVNIPNGHSKDEKVVEKSSVNLKFKNNIREETSSELHLDSQQYHNDEISSNNPSEDDFCSSNPREDDFCSSNPREDDFCSSNPREDDFCSSNPREFDFDSYNLRGDNFNSNNPPKGDNN